VAGTDGGAVKLILGGGDPGIAGGGLDGGGVPGTAGQGAQSPHCGREMSGWNEHYEQ
jgi:hypothetical protein